MAHAHARGHVALPLGFLVLTLLWVCVSGTQAGTPGRMLYEATSPYHHVRVVDDRGLLTLYFDDAPETQMTIADPLKGHFEYTEYFHMAWLWNTNIANALMVGLGGGSAQRSFAHYYPSTRIETVEIDPVVLDVARRFFEFKESDRQKVTVMDGRMYLKRSKTTYDLVVLDAYTQGRYGSSLPQHLATKEFFELVRDHLTTNGVVAYNIIGNQSSYRATLIGSMHRTLRAVFPQVYTFPARTSLNTVMIATRASVKAEPSALRQRADQLVNSGRVKIPGFVDRLGSLRTMPPPNMAQCPILTDDFAPVEGLAAQN